MAVAWMGLFATFLDKSPFYPLEAIARCVESHGPLARTIVLGAFVHQYGPSLFWGLMFGLMVWAFRPRRGRGLLLLGLLVGVLAQVVDVDVALPALSQGGLRVDGLGELHLHDVWAERVPSLVSWIGHLVFGVALSLYPWSYDPVAKTFD